jgi:hypothetical protein
MFSWIVLASAGGYLKMRASFLVSLTTPPDNFVTTADMIVE